MKIVFLDFDGVLNHIGSKIVDKMFLPEFAHGWRFIWIEKKQTEIFAKLFEYEGLEDAKIVVSSTWRESWNLDQLRQILDWAVPGLGARIIGTTSTNRYPGNYQRGEQIAEWVYDKVKQGDSYVIIDDIDEFLKGQHPRFVHTDYEVGITDLDVARAAAILKVPL
jgi:hypothetical protein